MDCLNKDFLNLIADKYFKRKQKYFRGIKVSNSVGVMVTNIHTFTNDYELHTVVDLTITNNTKSKDYITLTLNHVGTLICDYNQEYIFVHIQDTSLDISDADKHLAYDSVRGKLMTYEYYADIHELYNSDTDVFIWQ